MRYRTFGRRSGLRVSEYALGTGSFGTSGTGAGQKAVRAMFDAFVAAGGTTLDTSNIYQNGEAETLLGTMLGRNRDDLVVVTKYSGTPLEHLPPSTTGNSRKTMIRSLEGSLSRLNTEYVDVFMPHFADGVTPIDEILGALDDLIRSGKVRYGGLSNFPAWRVAGASVSADSRGLAPVAGIETEYSLAERSADRELLPMAEAYGLGVLLYSPLAGGLLSGKYRRGESGRLTAHGSPVTETDVQRRTVDQVIAIAEELGTTAVQVSLAWLRRVADEAQTALIPILGPRSLNHLEQFLRSLEFDLGDEHYQRLNDASAIRLGTPHEASARAVSTGYDGDRTALRAASTLPPT